MREFLLKMDGQQSGPYPESEVEARLASGKLSPETLCAEVGSEQWVAAKTVFPPKKKLSIRTSHEPYQEPKKEEKPAVPAEPKRTSTVHIARKTKEEESEMKTAVKEKLDPEVRKKLLIYNLADAIGVDKFTPEQAAAAIAIHEAELKRGKWLKITAGTGSLVVALVLASLLFNCVPVGTAPGGRRLKIFESAFIETADPELEKARNRALTDIKKLNALREEVAAAKFRAPRSQGDPRETFLNRIVIKDEDRDISTVAGTVDLSALKAVVPETMCDATKFELVQRNRSIGNISEKIKEQNDLFLILCTPLWTEDDFRKAIEEKMKKDYPIDAAVPESAEIWKLVRTFRLSAIEAQLSVLTERVADIADSKELQSRIQGKMEQKFRSRKKGKGASKGRASTAAQTASRINERKATTERAKNWAASKMPKFFEKFAAFLADNETYYSAEARQVAWADFVEKDLPELKEKAEENAKLRVELGGNGEFGYRGRDARNLLVVAHFPGAGDVYFVPEMASAEGDEPSTALAQLKDVKTERKELRPEDVLLTEKYHVAEKKKLGGVPMCATCKASTGEIYIVRTSPEWFYIAVAKTADEASESRNTPIWLGVPAEFFESVSVGDEIPMEKLLTFERYSRPGESSPTGRLMEISADKLPAVKAQQEAAGHAFPPPPEIFVPEVKKEKPQAKESAEPAETGEDASADGNAATEPTVPATEEKEEEPADAEPVAEETPSAGADEGAPNVENS